MGAFRTDGGSTWLNLLATQGQSFGARPVERLVDVAAVAEWLALMGFPPAGPPSEEDRHELIAVREALREVAMAAVEGRPVPTAALALVAQRALAVEGGADLAGECIPLRSAVAAICTQAIVTLRGPDRRYLTECAETDCRWVFLDPSGRRRWCPSPACSSRGRVRAHRAAQAQQAAQRGASS